MTEYLFTYGTLQPGHAPDEIAPAIEKLHPIGPGYFHGLLYDLGGHPGAILDPSANRKIYGTIYRLPDDAQLLSQLDAYEEFDPREPLQSLYLRTLITATLASGRSLPCWIYLYNRQPDPTRILAGGRWA